MLAGLPFSDYAYSGNCPHVTYGGVVLKTDVAKGVDLVNNRSVTVFYDERMLAHYPDTNVEFLPGRLDKRVRAILSGLNVQWKYPEHPGRLTAIMDLLTQEPVQGVHIATGKKATRDQLARVHTTSFLDDIYALRNQNAWLDVDTTAVSPGSVEAAEVAAGTAIAAVEAVVKGESQSAFALVRPQGHHAETARARGFCLFNNVAVAAAHAQAELGCERVMIVDWDAHHGNGTQNIFWAEPNVKKLMPPLSFTRRLSYRIKAFRRRTTRAQRRPVSAKYPWRSAA
jgi:hypothetical protein